MRCEPHHSLEFSAAIVSVSENMRYDLSLLVDSERDYLNVVWIEAQFSIAFWAIAVVSLDYFDRRLKLKVIVKSCSTFIADDLLRHDQHRSDSLTR